MYLAILDCGTALTFDASSLLPTTGESVPCRRHGYCVVEHRRKAPQPSSRRAGLRAGPRTQHELVEWLRGRSATTVHALRRERFTLRMLVAAERHDIVSVDVETGRVWAR